VIADIVRERGPLTVAAFMDLALYHPEFGYYARAARRSGRAGDFFTSVDVGPLFGELLEVQFAEMANLLESLSPNSAFDLVEAGAGNGRLAADVLRAMEQRHPDLLQRVRLSLVEASPAARAAQEETLRGIFDRPFASSEAAPDGIEGVVFANELLDAFPVHQVVMRDDGLREVYVEAGKADLLGPPRSDLRRADLLGPPGLRLREGPLSTPSLAAYLDRLHVELEPGWRAEINLRAVEWVRGIARRLRRGFVVLIDYGHEAHDLYSASHSAGTLTSFTRHTNPQDDSVPAWLEHPGDQDITAHVDFTSVRAAAEAEGLTTIGFLDQTYFILGLIGAQDAGRTPAFRERLALKTLLMPGGLGSTMKVLVFSKGVGRPALAGCSYRVRVT
jgi:SAM-dependent MidA family methyltransferase